MKTTEELVQQFIHGSISYAEGVLAANSKKANRSYHQIHEAAAKLRRADSLLVLQSLLRSEHVSVKIWAATYLLPIVETEAKEALLEIKDSGSILAFDARMTLEQWESGNLKYGW